MSVPSGCFVRRALLCSTAVVSIISGGSAMAQQAVDSGADAGAATEDSDVLIVTGSIRQSQEASINAKRRALNVADIAAADSVGRFPDQNSAAALSRLPAVAVQRDQGQERYIQVRGAPNRWTSVSIDGVPLTGVDEGGDSRAFRFDAVPAVMLSQMAVNKSITADMQADAVVATIDLETYSPMDLEGFHITGDAGYGFMEQGGGEQRQGSLRAGWSSDTFGVMVGGSHYRRKQLTDNREFSYDGEGPTTFDIRQYKLERWNNSLFAGIEVAASQDLRLFAKGIFTEFNDNEQRNQYVFDLVGDEDSPVTGPRGFESGDLEGVSVSGRYNFGEYRNRNYIATLGGDYQNDDGVTAEMRLNYTRTKNSSVLPLVISPHAGGVSLSYDASDPRFPVISLDGFDQSNFATGYSVMMDARQETVVDAYTGKFDIAKEFDSGLTLSGGLYYVDRDIEGNNFSFVNRVALAAGDYVGVPMDINSYVTSEAWDSQFPLGFTLNYVDNVGMRADLDDLVAAATKAELFNPAASIPVSDLYDQKESNFSAYAMGTLEADRLTINGGLRLEYYKMTNSGTTITEVKDGDDTDKFLTPLTVENDYTDFFPSLNIRYEATDDIVLRLAGQRSVSRPAYGAIRVGASVNRTTTPGSISGGNPYLKPEYTWGLDASVEYYLPTNGILSVSGFYRWVDNPFYSREEVIGTDMYGENTSDFLYGATFNGENGKLYGVEFNFQNQFEFLPSPFDGLGFQGNVTFLGGDFDIPASGGKPAEQDVAFQGLSDTIANASLYYEKYGFSARVSYQWRSDWLDTLGGMGSGEYRQGYENLDVSLRYAINENLTVFADMANLTDEIYVAYAGTPNTPTEVEQIGSRYMFGLRFDY